MTEKMEYWYLVSVERSISIFQQYQYTTLSC
ncbi:hypothetical protein C5L33_001362 [Lactobacillus pasteurii]|uniref:Uncharacterized protein n=1 Tax=Lactobacillus pasteurii DSM 23907 = CRBIP 24.76 TaxID=1423790 RepID=I7LDX9_9LACO|nr:hypothetical protein C5L33_001362 [Lactobacillus pasteurii]CCI85303.1 Protein of unknown function [Lactobacillus pasteurii DSM 23907 = CRBIP 24.76]